MINPKVLEVLNAIGKGVEFASELAQEAAPFVSLALPIEGAAMALIAPLAGSMIVKEGQIIATLNTDMTADQLKAALVASKSENWPAPVPITK